jgi:hypothetical protein
MASGYKLLLVTAVGCGACDAFKARMAADPSIKAAFFSEAKVVQLEVPSLNQQLINSTDPEAQRIPQKLKTSIGFFPFMALITNQNWDECVKNPSAQIRIEVFNGHLAGDGFFRPLQREMLQPNDKDHMVKWIRESKELLKQPPRAPNTYAAPTPAAAQPAPAGQAPAYADTYGSVCARRIKLVEIPK